MHTLYCVFSCLLSCTHTANTATLSRFTLEGLQPTCILSASTCNQRQPLHLKILPTIQRRKASRNHCRQFRQPGPNQPPQLAPTGQRSPLFRRIFADDPPQRAPAFLRACLHKYARLYEFLHIRNENYIPYSTNARKALISLAFKACTLCIRRQKVFTLENRARKALIFLRLRALHNQPICAKMTIYQYINSNLCGSML